MRQTTQHMRDHIKQQVSTLATCWRLERVDGQVFCWTSHDDDLIIDSETYSGAYDGGFDKSAIESRIGLGPTDLEVVGFLGFGIKRSDIEAGRFDDAKISIFIVDWKNPNAGKIDLRSGTLGEVTIADQFTYKVEIRGLAAPFTQIVGEIYSPECRANFCDKRCKLNSDDYRVKGEIIAVTDMRHVSIALDPNENETEKPVPAGMFDFGVVRFLTGDNADVTVEVKASDGATEVELKFQPPHPPAIGDEIEIIAGCNQRLETCKSYENVVNFRGEPFVPGSAKVFQQLGVR